MKKTIKRTVAMLITVCMLLSFIPTAFALPALSYAVSSADELEAALEIGASLIRIDGDFELDRTFYITKDTTVFSKKPHTLTRSADFGGDIFVVGEDEDGNSALLYGAPVRLTLGNKYNTDDDNTLVFDGNKDNMSDDVVGTVVFVGNSSLVDIYDGVSFINSHKDGNERTYDEKYVLSYPERIGGAAMIVASGSVNVYGGIFDNNTVNNEDTSEGAPADARDSSQGGAIYNYGNLKFHGGTVKNSLGARGGALYNYRTLTLLGGTFCDNRSYSHGGVVYQAGSQYANIILGQPGDGVGDAVLFKNNEAGTNGGAIYAYTQSSILGYGRTTFENNTAATAAGGAITCYGSLTLKNATFSGNTSATRGGALYISNADAALTARFNAVEGCVFSQNSAVSGGGAAALFSGDSSMPEGATAFFTDCTFTQNTAENTDGDSYGGALYVHRKSTLQVNGSLFEQNAAKTEGGALYLSGESNATVINSEFLSNTSNAGGAVSVRSSKLSVADGSFDKNTSETNGGAIYVSYVGDSAFNSDIKLDNCVFTQNSAVKYGGAFYATEHKIEKDTRVITSGSSIYEKNSAQKGGAAYITAGVEAYFSGDQFKQNRATSASGDDTNGAALYITDSNVKIDGASFTQNSADYNGGAVGTYSDSTFVMNNVTADGNTAQNAGGFLYNSGSDVKIYSSDLKNNSATDKTGGALSLHSEGTTAVYDTLFESNKAKTHGGAVYVYPGATETVLQDCEFKNNDAKSYGGAVYISNAALLKMYNNTATGNSAKNGGVLYATTTDTEVTLIGLTVSGNSATEGGAIIWGNTTKAKLNINKSTVTDNDVEGELDASYWESAIANKLKVTEIADSAPDYAPFVPEKESEVILPEPKVPVPVSDVFSIALSSSDEDINDVYAKLPRLDNSTNFMSRGTKYFENINGKTVTVDSYVYHLNKAEFNPNVGQALLIYQTMLYKQAHPDEEVSLDVSSFHLSNEAAVCINRNSRYFGYMRSLGDREYDEYGFVRISYLLVSAAKMGIDVTVIGQIDAYPRTNPNLTFVKYFTSHLDTPCDPAYADGYVGDYLDFKDCEWTSYGDNTATDMMHVKVCASSHYLDMNGVEHENAVWMSSVNLDGILPNGLNGNNSMQVGVIISDHEDIYRVSSNYVDLMARYCGQEDIYRLRDLVIKRNTEQIDLITEGKGDTIPKDEQIVYLGSENDDVFEMYFAPFGGDRVVWDETYNPYCKYLRNLYNSEDSIVFIWNNVKYDDFALGKQMQDVIADAFYKNKSTDNKLYIAAGGFDYSVFDGLKVGVDIGFKSLGSYKYGGIHSKDIQMSYVKDGQRYYVSLLNSLNMHGGSMSYQTNHLLVIKEKSCDGTSVFFDIANHTTKGVVPIVDDSSKTFSDVKNLWYKNAVDYCYTNGYISGMSKTEFGIGTSVTRGMFITVLARMAGVDTSEAANAAALSKFNDVTARKYYSAAVKWASENGIVAGVSATEFMPDSPITRQQLCVMTVNFAKHQGIVIREVENALNFADANDIQPYAKNAVALCQRADIVNGYTEGAKVSFRPTATATRAEAAQILFKFHTN